MYDDEKMSIKRADVAGRQSDGDSTAEYVSANDPPIWYSDRIATRHPDLVDESADWLEDQLGVLNLGQIDYKILMADGVLTDKIRDGLIAWWAARDRPPPRATGPE